MNEDFDLKTHETPTSYCPSCNGKLERASNADEKGVAPKAGDYSICFYCGEIHVFGPDLRVALMSATERAEAPEEINELARKIKQYRARPPAPKAKA